MDTTGHQHRVITLTGGDCAGKETQTKLLTHVLTPSVRMSAPDYNHWAGHIIQSILRKQDFSISSGDREGEWSQSKHPQVLQLLHNINTWDKQEIIRETLKTSHIVMDRYIEDAYAFGLIDGCSFDFLLELNRNFIQSDMVILLLGEGYPRAGEVQDINEQDREFQQKVRGVFWSLVKLFPNWKPINIDHYRGLEPHQSIHCVHTRVCWLVSELLGEKIHPLSLEEVKVRVWAWEKERLQALTTS